MNLIPQAVRRGAMQLLGPLVQLMVRLHVRPNTITTIGTLIVVASAVAFAIGRPHWGGFLLLFSGIFDMLDGRVARDGDAGTTFGAFYDSTLDRVGESALFTGIAIYFLNGGVTPERLGAGVVLSSITFAFNSSFFARMSASCWPRTLFSSVKDKILSVNLSRLPMSSIPAFLSPS